jgi:hypothetical protein
VPPTADSAAAIEPSAYTPAWFAWIRQYRPEMAALYRLGSDESDLAGDDLADDDLADDDLADGSLVTEGDNK